MSEEGKGNGYAGCMGGGGRPLRVMVSDVHRSPHSVTPPSPIPTAQTNLHMTESRDAEATGE